MNNEVEQTNKQTLAGTDTRTETHNSKFAKSLKVFDEKSQIQLMHP